MDKFFKRKELRVEVSKTPLSRERGLMFRRNLESNSGMLFKFNYPEKLKFWGLNTYIPLDIAFISPENKIIKIDNISPMSTKMVSSDQDCLMAVEANLDFFSKNKINVGDKIDIIEDSIDTFVVFN